MRRRRRTAVRWVPRARRGMLTRCDRPVALYIRGMVHVVVILAVIGVVCHMIGDSHTIHRE